MDSLDYDLYSYLEDWDHRCSACGEYCDDEWECDCDEHLGI